MGGEIDGPPMMRCAGPHDDTGDSFVDLTGEVAIVTGASRGIGFSIANRLLRCGARVCITGRDDEALRSATRALGGADRAIHATGGADDVAHQQEAIAHTTNTFGPVTVLVNNVGINPVFGPTIDLELSTVRKVLDVNCVAPLSWAQQAYRAGMAEHGGAIVNVASVAGTRPARGLGVYGGSKAMLSYLTAQLALELAPRVRVNAVAPAVVKTRFAEALYSGREVEVADAYPMKRLGTPTDVGSLVAFLASRTASWLTGQTIVLDGGLTLTGGV